MHSLKISIGRYLLVLNSPLGLVALVKGVLVSCTGWCLRNSCREVLNRSINIKLSYEQLSMWLIRWSFDVKPFPHLLQSVSFWHITLESTWVMVAPSSSCSSRPTGTSVSSSFWPSDWGICSTSLVCIVSMWIFRSITSVKSCMERVTAGYDWFRHALQDSCALEVPCRTYSMYMSRQASSSCEA